MDEFPTAPAFGHTLAAAAVERFRGEECLRHTLPRALEETPAPPGFEEAIGKETLREHMRACVFPSLGKSLDLEITGLYLPND